MLVLAVDFDKENWVADALAVLKDFAAQLGRPW